MRDEMNTNSLSVTGTPSLVSGALTVDPDQALTFSGPTSFASAVDSTSLSITSSLSIEFFVNLPSLPGATRDLVRKTGSYAVQVDTSGHVLFALNGATVATSSTTLAVGTWYHIVCVYNNNYAGTARFGNAAVGSSTYDVADDDGNNKAVSRFTLLESALLNTVYMSLKYTDEIFDVQMRAVVYSVDGSGNPDALVTSSPIVLLRPPNPAWRVSTWVPFTLTPALVPAGQYYLGYVADTISNISKSVITIGRATSGGATRSSGDSVSSPADPFGVVASSSADLFSAYCDYTAVGRTGNEGYALIYINGAKNVSQVYSTAIADTANALEVAPAMVATVDELSIWNKPLSAVQIANHYTAH